MPYHKKKQVKGKTRVLTKAQKSTLEKHKVHHSAKHMALMRKKMREGMSFSRAHAIAQKQVGK